MQKSTALVLDKNTERFARSVIEWNKYSIQAQRVDSIEECIRYISKNSVHLVVLVFDDTCAQKTLDSIEGISALSLAPIVLAAEQEISPEYRIAAHDKGAVEIWEIPEVLPVAIAKGSALIRKHLHCAVCLQNGNNTTGAANPYAVLNFEHKTVFVRGKKVELTKTEFNILWLLMHNPGQVFSCEQIYSHIWQEDTRLADAKRTIWTLMERLRKKIQVDPAMPELIQTRRGNGYCFYNNY